MSHCCTSCLPHPKKFNTLSQGTLLSGLMPSYVHAQTHLLVFDSFHRHKRIAIVITFVVIKFKNSWRSIVPPSLLPVFIQSARIKVNGQHGTRRNICDICNTKAICTEAHPSMANCSHRLSNIFNLLGSSGIWPKNARKE